MTPRPSPPCAGTGAPSPYRSRSWHGGFFHRRPGPPEVVIAACLSALVLAVVPGRTHVSAGSSAVPSAAPAARVAQGTAETCSPAWLRSGSPVAATTARSRPDPVMVQAATVALATPPHTADDIAQEGTGRYPNDQYFRFWQRNLLTMGVLDAWETSRGSSDVTVAVISTGVQWDHPDLAAKIWRNPGETPGNGIDDDGNGYVDDVRGWNFPAHNNDPMDIPRGRGTMMAGVIGAATNNAEGIAGLSWGARIMPLKTLVLQQDGEGQRAVGTISDIVAAVCYAADNGADVIVFGGYLRDPSNAEVEVQRLHQAIRYAYTRAVLVAPAGDCAVPQEYCPSEAYGPNPPIFPAAFDKEVIGAQSFAGDYQARAEASRGEWVDISAPGEDFMTTILDDAPYKTVKHQRATSDFAAAHVAGVLAVLRSINPDLFPRELEALLCKYAGQPRGVAFEPGADNLPYNEQWGCGYVRFDRAVDGEEPLIRVRPTVVRQFTDGTQPWPRIVFENAHLRASRWMVNPVSALWVRAEPVRDGVDGVARAVLVTDLDQLRRDRGGLQAGTYGADLQACPLGTFGDRTDLCQPLRYELTYVDRIWRIHLPVAMRD
jgi:subtilisin family serine protease